jgi:hypothetical protein
VLNLPPLDQADLDALRAVLREKLEPIHASLDVIERKLSLLPDLLFLYDSAVAQEVVQALRKANAPPLTPHEGLMVPGGAPGKPRADRWVR